VISVLKQAVALGKYKFLDNFGALAKITPASYA